MLLEISAALLAGTLGLTAVRYRRARDEDEPVRLWHREWASAADAASALATATELACERSPDDWRWLSSLLLAPVWLFWGPMTSMQPELRLARWRLVGARPSGRALRIAMPSERARIIITCQARTPLWASASRGGATWPLEQQEGLRLLHPIGSVRWQEGAALIRAAFAFGLDRLRVDNEMLRAEVNLDERGPSLEEYPRVMDALEDLAIWIESIAGA